MTDGQLVSMSWCWAHFGTFDKILSPVGRLLSESCGLVSVGREDGSAVCSAITQWSKSRRTHNHTIMSHLRLPNLDSQVPVFIFLRNRVAQLYLWALGSLYVASYHSQGYSGGILTLSQNWRARSLHIHPPGTGWSSPKSKSRYNQQLVNQYVLVSSPRGTAELYAVFCDCCVGQSTKCYLVTEVHNMWEVPTEVPCNCCVGQSTKCYLLSEVRNIWEVPMEGSHRTYFLYYIIPILNSIKLLKTTHCTKRKYL
jgi:hypothetical protein